MCVLEHETEAACGHHQAGLPRGLVGFDSGIESGSKSAIAVLDRCLLDVVRDWLSPDLPSSPPSAVFPLFALARAARLAALARSMPAARKSSGCASITKSSSGRKALSIAACTRGSTLGPM